jgi:hypothetical protein
MTSTTTTTEPTTTTTTTTIPSPPNFHSGKRITLFLIGLQKYFHSLNGSLCVPTALEDAQRIVSRIPLPPSSSLHKLTI